jgi:Protein of unknown function (DUF732)
LLVVDPRSAPCQPEQAPLPSAPRPRQPEGESPAGLGPWVPPLPPSRPALSARALTWLGIVAVLLLISAAAATAVLVAGAAGPPASPSLDARYLGSVRGNSTLTGVDIDDDRLVRAGHEICGIVDRRPTISTVLGMMQQIGRAQRWSDDDVAAVVGSAIGAYCPRYIAVLDR